MLEVNGICYYIDFSAMGIIMNSFLNNQNDEMILGEVEEREYYSDDGEKRIDYVRKSYLNQNDSKFKASVIIDECLKNVLSYREMLEDEEEHDDTKEPTAYKLSFNSLLKCGIIKELKIE